MSSAEMLMTIHLHKGFSLVQSPQADPATACQWLQQLAITMQVDILHLSLPTCSLSQHWA